MLKSNGAVENYGICEISYKKSNIVADADSPQRSLYLIFIFLVEPNIELGNSGRFSVTVIMVA